MTDEKLEPLPTVSRSPELMNPGDTGLLVIDVQEKLIAVQPEGERITWNVRRLLDGAKLLGVPSAATEQYPGKAWPNNSRLWPSRCVGPAGQASSPSAAEPAKTSSRLGAPKRAFIASLSAASKPTFASSKPCSI